jgi:hypothetical protein
MLPDEWTRERDRHNDPTQNRRSANVLVKVFTNRHEGRMRSNEKEISHGRVSWQTR